MVFYSFNCYADIGIEMTRNVNTFTIFQFNTFHTLYSVKHFVAVLISDEVLIVNWEVGANILNYFARLHRVRSTYL